MKYDKQKNVVIVGEFRNQYGEEFIIFFSDSKKLGTVLYITGDEFDWECIELYLIGARDYVRIIATNKGFTGRFLFSKEEQLEIARMVKDFNPDIIDWLMLP